MKRVLAILACSILTFGGVVIGATPSQAGPTNPANIFLPDVGACAQTQFRTAASGGGTALPAIFPAGLDGSTGDTISLTNECAVTVYVNTGGNSPGTWVALAAGATATYTLTSSTYFQANSTNNMGYVTIAQTGISGVAQGGGGGAPNGGAGSGSAGSAAPAPVLQQFGLPSSGTCDAAAPNELNWSGVASGGWAESWAQWMNGGLGGAVCTRDLVYSTGTGSWGVAQ